MKKLLLLILPLLFLLQIACDSATDEKPNESSISKYELIKTDSIIVDFMEAISLLDYYHERKRILGYNGRSGNYIEFDMTGKILNQVNLTGDGPNDHGKNTYQVNYLGDGKVGVAAIGRYFTYNQDWEVEGKVDFEYEGSYAVTASGSYRTSGNPQMKDSPFISIAGLGLFVRKKEDLNQPHLFHLNTETGEGNYFHQFPDSSIFMISDEFYINTIEAISSYNYEEKVLDVIHRGEAILYRYDVSEAIPKLITSYKFDYDNPYQLKGIPFDAPPEVFMSGGGLISAFNQKLSSLYSFEDKQLVTYVERHPMAELISPNEQDNEKLREFYNTPTSSWAYLIKNGKRISENMPIGSPRIALQLGNGRFLSTRYIDPNVETDTQLFYIYELREVGE